MWLVPAGLGQPQALTVMSTCCPGTAFFCSICGLLHLNLGGSLGFAI